MRNLQEGNGSPAPEGGDLKVAANNDESSNAESPPPVRRGRPKGSKNKPKTIDIGPLPENTKK